MASDGRDPDAIELALGGPATVPGLVAHALPSVFGGPWGWGSGQVRSAAARRPPLPLCRLPLHLHVVNSFWTHTAARGRRHARLGVCCAPLFQPPPWAVCGWRLITRASTSSISFFLVGERKGHADVCFGRQMHMTWWLSGLGKTISRLVAPAAYSLLDGKKKTEWGLEVGACRFVRVCV